MSETRIVVDPRVRAVMEAGFNHWRENADRHGAHMEKARSIDDMPDGEWNFAAKQATVCILKWLEQEASTKMVEGFWSVDDDTGVPYSGPQPRATYTAMCAAASFEITGVAGKG